jgi:monofunctional biosynthetic peptidoglycan transglycosylase
MNKEPDQVAGKGAEPDVDPVERAMADARSMWGDALAESTPAREERLATPPEPKPVPAVEPEIPAVASPTAVQPEPAPISDPDRRQMARIRKTLGLGKRRSLLGRIVKWAVIIALVPFVLTILYIPSFVRPISTLMVLDLVQFQGYDRRWTPLEDIAPAMQHSVIMSEDGQFCRHFGVDLGELKGVVTDALEGEDVRGASTIPMQTVKNLYLFNIRSVLRKAVELPIAVFYDLVTPKRRILETYLNIAEWGPNIYGVEAAAQHYFGVSAKNLSRRQAALLTVALPNPYTRNPAKPGPGMRALARRVERLAGMAGGHVECLK